MEFKNEFTVPAPAQDVWRVLLDVERIAPCLPGASVERVEGDEVAGRVKVKVGPVQLSYHGTARFVEKNEALRRFVLEGSGREARGAGTAAATITVELHEVSPTTRVSVHTDLNVTGKPAQFGRGVMADVADKLIGEFATCLAGQVRTPAVGASATHAQPNVTATRSSDQAAVNLLGVAARPVLKRLAPILAGLALILIGVALGRRQSLVISAARRLA
jgi:carbon monoxide dehydrogenase subunit G